ncbi:MAG: hypothetical protein IPM06_19420 [Rhizobiales bacterium]|nr:hypothetical protein [Hyphomicrobiales bacterium]
MATSASSTSATSASWDSAAREVRDCGATTGTHFGRCQIQASVEKCAECVVFENNTGYNVDTAGSFDYSSYDLAVQANVGQNGVAIRKGSVAVSSGSPGTQFVGVDMKIRGNFGTHASANGGVAFGVGVEGDSTDAVVCRRDEHGVLRAANIPDSEVPFDSSRDGEHRQLRGCRRAFG